jgi:hypothetical protein
MIFAVHDCCWRIEASHIYESLNVLVPSNDVNVHAKIKKLLIDDDANPKDFSDNELMKLNNLKIPEIDKQLFYKINSKINNDDNKHQVSDRRNIADNVQFSEFSNDIVENNDDIENLEIIARVARDGNSIIANEVNLSELENSTVEYYSTVNSTTTSPSLLTSSVGYLQRTFTHAVTTNSPTTYGNNTTIDFYTITTPFPFNQSTTLHSESNSTTANLTSSTVFATEFTIPITTPTIPTSTAEPSPSTKEECLLGQISDVLMWVMVNGTLDKKHIRENNLMKDFTFADYSQKSLGDFNAEETSSDFLINFRVNIFTYFLSSFYFPKAKYI